LAVALAFFAGAQSAAAQTETLLYSFQGGTSDGGYPQSGLTFDSSGNLYGTTYYGGSHSNGGTVYELSPGSPWTEKVLYNFGATGTGVGPLSSLIFDSSGNLYGTTTTGGTSNLGTQYILSPGTSWTQLAAYSFAGGATGQNPYDYGQLVMDSSGNVYGTTYAAGAHSQGNVFEMTYEPLNNLIVETVLYSFDATTGHNDGDDPHGGLVMDSSGNLYGVTTTGGSHSGGTVFEISGGTETVLWDFGGTGDGTAPYGGLIIDSSGNLYGTTYSGGAHNLGTVFEVPSGGGSDTVLHSFGGTGDGAEPYNSLLMDSSGNLYGTTVIGGAHADGTVFKLSSTLGVWSESVLYSFSGGTTDGAYPYCNLVMDSSGNLYGSTWEDGAHSYGAVFKLVP